MKTANASGTGRITALKIVRTTCPMIRRQPKVGFHLKKRTDSADQAHSAESAGSFHLNECTDSATLVN